MNIALILSGGTGTRLGADIPKQYIEAGDRPVLSYCVETLSAHENIDALWLVAASSWRQQIRVWLERADVGKKFRGFSDPGENRQLSILHGLEDIQKFAADSDTVLIHDAARPLLSPKMISDCLAAMERADGVLPVLPMKDTVYSSATGKRVDALLNRNEIYAGQAPEAFRFGKYLEANRRLLPDRILEINGSTEPAILANMNIAMIPGDETNFKITTRADLERFCEMAKRKTQREEEEKG